MIKLRILSLIAMTALFAGCPTKKVPSQDNLQSHQNEINSRVQGFVKGFYSENQSLVMSHAGFPFLMNSQAILSYPMELEQVLAGLFKKAKPATYRVLHSQIFSPKFMSQFNRSMWAFLLEQGFHEKAYVFQLLEVQDDKQTFQEKIVLIVDPLQDWKVVGIISSD